MTDFLGIDPGLFGGIAHHDGARLVGVIDMPSSNNEVDAAQLAYQLRKVPRAVVVVERQQAFPGQGVSTSFKLGLRYGIVLGVVASLELPLEIVSPVRWKGFTKTTRDKDGARARASQLMPEGAHLWLRKMDHGRAEAALLAYYGAMTLPHRSVAA